MILISVDSGKKGALVRFENGFVTDITNMPLKPWGNNHIVNADILMTQIENWEMGSPDPIQVIIEKVGPGPRDGVASACNFMQNFGILQGTLEPHYNVDYVLPTIWKTWAGLRGLVKSMSIVKAIQKHPEARALIEDHTNAIDRADAVLIGAYYWNIKMKGGRLK